MKIQASVNGGVNEYKIHPSAMNYKTAYTKALLPRRITELFVDEFTFLFGKVVAWNEDSARIGAIRVRVPGALITSHIGTILGDLDGEIVPIKGALLYCSQRVISPYEATRHYLARVPTLFATFYKFE